ncbi:MAG: hypothetical protein HY897_01285 [Deltaproteobacteria bacterium]|nr:hypothetical protein [Deltaproteobacteria bacterium]
MSLDLHKLADERSLELHREIARRLNDDPTIVARAREKVARWLAEGTVHPVYAQEWAAILDGPLEGLLAVLTGQDQHSTDLRHVTPFSFVVPPRERWRIWRETRERLEAAK